MKHPSKGVYYTELERVGGEDFALRTVVFLDQAF
jgi:hypothetical protein